MHLDCATGKFHYLVNASHHHHVWKAPDDMRSAYILVFNSVPPKMTPLAPSFYLNADDYTNSLDSLCVCVLQRVPLCSCPLLEHCQEKLLLWAFPRSKRSDLSFVVSFFGSITLRVSACVKKLLLEFSSGFVSCVGCELNVDQDMCSQHYVKNLLDT